MDRYFSSFLLDNAIISRLVSASSSLQILLFNSPLNEPKSMVGHWLSRAAQFSAKGWLIYVCLVHAAISDREYNQPCLIHLVGFLENREEAQQICTISGLDPDYIVSGI